jgi:hypothetical protein
LPLFCKAYGLAGRVEKIETISDVRLFELPELPELPQPVRAKQMLRIEEYDTIFFMEPPLEFHTDNPLVNL